MQDVGTTGAGAARNEEHDGLRRADLATSRALQADEAALLASKEKALQDALLARSREQAGHTPAAGRTPQERAGNKRRQREAAQLAARAEEQRATQQLAATRQVENARRKREQAAEVARRKAEDVRRKAREEALRQARLEEQQAQRRAMEEQAIRRAALELAQKPTLKPVDARVRTRLETPSRQRRTTVAEDEPRRRRQPGAPNLYSLRPFRNTPDIRARAGQSRRIMRRSLATAAGALGLAVILGAVLFKLPPPPPAAGADAIAVDPGQGLLLLAGDRLLPHDRAGVSLGELPLRDLGLAELSAPLTFTATGDLLAPGRGDTDRQAATPPQLMRCVLAEAQCQVFSEELAGTVISALAVHPLDGHLYIADSSAGQLLKVDASGKVLARAATELPEQPVLRLDSGLLLLNSATGPSIAVLRYENDAFAQQLDEIPLLPPGAAPGEISGVRDFLRNGEHWWVLLQRADGAGAGLFRFDTRWQFSDRPALAPGGRPTHLVNWGGRVLVGDPSGLPIQRFSSEGAAQAPLVSTALTALHTARARSANLALLGWRIGLALCLLVALAGLGTGWLHRARSLVYTSCREQGAEPLDKLADHIDWAEVRPDRDTALRRIGVAYGAMVAVSIAGAIGGGISSLQLAAMLLFLTGPAIALLLLQRSDPGHIGIAAEQLLLVDHNGLYHMGQGSRIHHRGPFLMIDDVTVFTGAGPLPAFVEDWIAGHVAPLAAAGVRVDCTMVSVKLLQGRHPLALGAVAMAATGGAALALLSLHGIF